MAFPPHVVHLFHLHNYPYQKVEPQKWKHDTLDHHLQSLRNHYETEGVRTTIEGILLVHMNNLPYIFLLKRMDRSHKLPGGRLRQGQDEIQWLKRKLSHCLASGFHPLLPQWQIGECVATWLRPKFDKYIYQYDAPHIREPKERVRLFLVNLPDRAYFRLPRYYDLFAVPLSQLDGNLQRYGPLAFIPRQLTSRFQFNTIPKGITDQIQPLTPPLYDAQVL